jgi:hypothetical protein
MDEDGFLADELLPKRSLTNALFCKASPGSEQSWESSYSQTGLPFLWQTYVNNVHAVMKAIHVPTTQLVIDEVLSGSDQISKGTYCLLAAIKFAAVISLTDDQCWAALNSSRKSLLDLFRVEVQTSLNSANFLSRHTMITLQAFFIFQVKLLQKA